MKPAITITIGAIALIAALMFVVVDVCLDAPSDDRKFSMNKQTEAASVIGDESRPTKRRVREDSPESKFLRHFSKIKPNTDYQDASDGYFQGYLAVRSAEQLRDGGEQDDDIVLERYEKAYALFLGVRESASDWKVEMVQVRLDKTKDGLREAYFAKNGR
jgi:hypothetical protein